MSCFKKIGDTISSKSKEIVSSAKAVSETSSLNNIIKAEQRKIETNYKMIGKLYVEKYGSSPSDEFAESINAVNDSLEKINETKEQIAKIRSRNHCPNCGVKFRSSALFCSKCGTKVREPDAEPIEVKCTNCGNLLEADAQFCDNCGMKVDNIASENEVSEEITAQCESISTVNAVEIAAAEVISVEAKPVEHEIKPETAVKENANAQDITHGVRMCPSCGEDQTDEQALFCTKCGTKL